ncbi:MULTISPECIES: hypothetical protein [unclassified Prochlorococcus]|uniref:hypothetical protein n=1 Tax=unclassified Prochlorococcus TaxID=2627481 RepID=UPI000ADAD07A|nr:MULTISPECIES: hypothetical protein [unclassified Prochlorococcus]
MTRISIAHRLSTLQQAGKIVVLERNQPKQVMLGKWDELNGHGYLASMLASH